MGLKNALLLKDKDKTPILKVILANGPQKPYYYTKYGMTLKGCFLRMSFPYNEKTSGLISSPISSPISGPIDEKININESAIQKHINTLKEKGYILRIGGNRGYWKLNLTKK